MPILYEPPVSHACGPPRRGVGDLAPDGRVGTVWEWGHCQRRWVVVSLGWGTHSWVPLRWWHRSTWALRQQRDGTP